MTEYVVTFWVDGHSDVKEVTVSEADRDDAIASAKEQLREDGHEDWNLKQISKA